MLFIKNRKITALIPSVVWWLLSFIYEKHIFDMNAVHERLFTYISIKIILFFSLYIIFSFLFDCADGIKNKNDSIKSFVYAVPYCVIFLIWAGTHGGYMPFGDEIAISGAAKLFDNDKGMFTYMTTYFHMLAMQIIPNIRFILIFKIILSGLALGYSVMRINRHFGSSWYGFLLYGIFLAPVSFDQGLSSHRMPMYGMLALVFMTKLWCDNREHSKLDAKNFIIMSVCAAVLTQWRVEGIYMLVLSPVIIILAYGVRADKKLAAFLVAAMLLIQGVVYYPQVRETSMADEYYVARRSVHFYNFILPNMLRNGIDREKNAEELFVVDKYLYLNSVDELNEKIGDLLYTDELITWYDYFNRTRPEATDEDLVNYEHAVQRMVLKNPFIYVKTQLVTFVKISFAYDRGTILGIAQIIFGNLIAPLGLLIVMWIISIKNRQWLNFFCLSGPLCHTAITTALLPAGYFKYYYMQYVAAGFAVVLLIIKYLGKNKRISI